LLRRPGFWLMTLTAAACCLPVVLWNVRHDWVGLRHVAGQAGIHAGALRWWGPLAFVGTQAALLLGVWFVAWSAAMTAWRPGRTADAGVRYLWWMSVPTFAVFFLFSLRTAEQPNWPVTAYLSGLVLTTAWLARWLTSLRRGPALV